MKNCRAFPTTPCQKPYINSLREYILEGLRLPSCIGAIGNVFVQTVMRGANGRHLYISSLWSVQIGWNNLGMTSCWSTFVYLL